MDVENMTIIPGENNFHGLLNPLKKEGKISVAGSYIHNKEGNELRYDILVNGESIGSIEEILDGKDHIKEEIANIDGHMLRYNPDKKRWIPYNK